MDPLTPLLRACHVDSALFSRAWLQTPWSVEASPMAHGVFHGVLRGACWMVPVHDPDAAVRLEAGDVILLPHGHGHIMCDDPCREAAPIASLTRPGPREGMGELRVMHSGARADVELICGKVVFAHAAGHPVLQALPPVVFARGGEAAGAHSQWLAQTLAMIRHELEVDAPGAQEIVARLADLVFLQALRVWIEGADHPTGSWMAGLSDPRIARALACVHAAPGEPWTVDALAREAGMSRSGFTARFGELVGCSPYQHLKGWRMHLACQALLDERHLTLAELAERLGYSTEHALSKAFRQTLGTSPTGWRERHAA